MDLDDVIYLILLFSSIGFGVFYRKIENVEVKKLTGTLVGLGIMSLVSGLHILHIFILIFINIAIISLCSIRICHLVSFTFSFSYLIFFRTTEYFGIPYPPAHTNLIVMMLILKLVGLAFELNNTHTRNIKGKGELSLEQIAEKECNDINPSMLDIVHYSCNYISILTGPYYSYRTFRDSFQIKFYKYTSNETTCLHVTFKKLSYIPLFAVLFLTAAYIWPISYVMTDEFYDERSVLYRLWYCMPVFFIFRMRLYIGMTLSECVCTMAGLGAYPDNVVPKPGAGPTTNFKILKEIYDNPDRSKTECFNFETIHNIYPYGADFCTTFRDAIKCWNMCVQYWLAVNIYKRFPSKQFRTFITMFVSAIWHGVYIGHYFTICGAPFYLAVEDIYIKLFLKDKKNSAVCEWILWVIKMFAFSYLSVAFHLLTVPRVMRYYNSLYHTGAIIGLIMYVMGIFIAKSRKRSKKDYEDAKDK